MHEVLPEAQVMQIDTQANVIEALEVGRVDAAAVDLSTVNWLVARNPDKYADSGKSVAVSMLYGAAMRQGDLDWLNFVNTAFEIAMFGHENALFDAAFKEYFGDAPPTRKHRLPDALISAIAAARRPGAGGDYPCDGHRAAGRWATI